MTLQRGSTTTAVLLLLVVTAIVIGFILTRPKPTEQCTDEVGVRAGINAMRGRLLQVDVGLAAFTVLVALTASFIFRSHFWPTIPARRYMYPAAALSAVGLLLLVVMAAAPMSERAARLFGTDAQVFRCADFVSQEKVINTLAVGLLCAPLLAAGICYVADRVISRWKSPKAVAQRLTT